MTNQNNVGESFAEKFADDVRRVFVWGDTPENPWEHLIQTLKSKPVAERELLRAMLTTVRNALPQELVDRHDGKAGVMFFREFVEGPIRDVIDMPRQELEGLVATNEKFREQMLGFVTISMENINTLCAEHFDVLGRNNLVVAGPKGNEVLVLLEPHNCEMSGLKGNIDQRIEDRVLYLQEVVSSVCQ